MGWWLDYLCRLKRIFGFERDYILYELPLIEGWAWYSWAIQNNGAAEVELVTDGYLAQERERQRQLERARRKVRRGRHT